METLKAQSANQVSDEPEQREPLDVVVRELSNFELTLIGGGLGAVSFY
ncbi:MAG: hypothetical protein L6Q72_05800 [Burkholderiaceae bacterium]|nr:hypothetical protein [Burkholderiaceae bacterium]GIL05060.1 MAG: hypothetical protein BroJett031_15800 [Betaproteobacteria bacterium]